jgi:hypothetical protein
MAYTYNGKYLREKYDHPHDLIPNVKENEVKDLDFSRPIRTKHGLEVEIISTGGRPGKELIGYIGTNLLPSTWNAEGQYCDTPSEMDLENVPEVRNGVVGIVLDSNGELRSTGIYADEKTLRTMYPNVRVLTVLPFEIELN